MLDLANKVAKLQCRLVLSTFRQKSHSSLVLNTEHNGVMHRRVASTCSCEHARARLILIEIVRFVESLRKLAQSSDFQKNMDQWRDRRQYRTNNTAPTINGPRMLKWYSSHPSRILVWPIMHIMPFHISRICEVSFIRIKHMTQKWDICAHFSTNPITEIDAFYLIITVQILM